MQRTNFGDMACSIARTLDVMGEPWTPLVIRDVFVGMNRFDQIQQDLGISRKVLAERLHHLVEHGVLERRPYDNRPRYEYHLTDRGTRALRCAHGDGRVGGHVACRQGRPASPLPPPRLRSGQPRRPALRPLRRADARLEHRRAARAGGSCVRVPGLGAQAGRRVSADVPAAATSGTRGGRRNLRIGSWDKGAHAVVDSSWSTSPERARTTWRRWHSGSGRPATL